MRNPEPRSVAVKPKLKSQMAFARQSHIRQEGHNKVRHYLRSLPFYRIVFLATVSFAAPHVAFGQSVSPFESQAPYPYQTSPAANHPVHNAATSGEFTVDRPTLISLGFQWKIEGDDNRNASVTVEYRKKGDTAWKQGLPFLRTQNELIGYPPGTTTCQPCSVIYHWEPNSFAGSIFNLEPGTEYETRFTLSDPDGVKGPKVKTATVRTRNEPMPAAGGHIYHVYPYDYKGPKQQPAFTGLLAAYYTNSLHADYFDASPPRVQPGDTILVHAGLYKDARNIYGNADPGTQYGTYFDGTYYLTVSGTADKPIVIKGAGDGEAIFDGDNNSILFDVTAANNLYFENLTIRNTDVGFLTGRKHIVGSSGFTLKHCKLENVSRGVHGDWSGSKDFYIADNVFVGRANPNQFNSDKLINGPTASEYAVKVYGQGHVVAYNRISGFHDGVDFATYGNPDGTPDKPIPDRYPASNDFYGNDVNNAQDNCFEADGSGRNMRIFRNRCFDSHSEGLSLAPAFGGPAYFFQNVIYNNPGGVLKFGQASGSMVYQNTIIGECPLWNPSVMPNQHFLNNLILSQDSVNAQGKGLFVFSVDTDTNYSTSDYNGFRPNPKATNNFGWNSPPFEVMVDYDSKPRVQRPFKTLAEYSAAIHQDTHSILIDYDVFQKVTPPDTSTPTRLYDPKDFDFRLKPDSKAVDAGVLIPNIDDGFSGKAPDLGAYELGAEIPHYGPR